MTNRKYGIRVLTLSFLAAGGLLSFMASGAQGEFLILGAPALLATLTGSIDTLSVLLVPALNIEIDCTDVDIIKGEFTSATEGSGEVLYLNCVYRIIDSLPTKPGIGCTIKTGGVVGDLTASYKLKSIGPLLVKAEGAGAGGRIVLVESEKCTIPNLVEVRGSAELKLSSDSAIKQLVVEVPLGTLKYGANPAFLDGSAWVELSGAHAKCTWGSI